MLNATAARLWCRQAPECLYQCASDFIQVLSSACVQGGYGAGLPPPMLMPQAAGGMQGLQAVPGYQAVNLGVAPGMYAAPQHMQHMPQQYSNPQPPAPHMNGSLF